MARFKVSYWSDELDAFPFADCSRSPVVLVVVLVVAADAAAADSSSLAKGQRRGC